MSLAKVVLRPLGKMAAFLLTPNKKKAFEVSDVITGLEFAIATVIAARNSPTDRKAAIEASVEVMKFWLSTLAGVLAGAAIIAVSGCRGRKLFCWARGKRSCRLGYSLL